LDNFDGPSTPVKNKTRVSEFTFTERDHFAPVKANLADKFEESRNMFVPSPKSNQRLMGSPVRKLVFTSDNEDNNDNHF
jgi:hypothetical protein